MPSMTQTPHASAVAHGLVDAPVDVKQESDDESTGTESST